MFWNIHLNVIISFQPRYNRQFGYAISCYTKSSPVWCRHYRTWFSILWQNGNTPESRVIFIKWILSSRVYSYSKYIHIKPILYKLQLIALIAYSISTYIFLSHSRAFLSMESRFSALNCILMEVELEYPPNITEMGWNSKKSTEMIIILHIFKKLDVCTSSKLFCR